MRVKDDSEKAGWKLNIQKTKIMASCLITSWQIEGEKEEAVTGFIFFSTITVDSDCSHEIRRQLVPWKEHYDKLRQCIKKWKHHFVNKGLYSWNSCFFSSHVQMWELDHKEGWVLTNWCFWIVVLEKTLENPLDCKEIKPVNPKGNQLWIFTGRSGAKAEATIFWPPDTKNWFIGEDPDAGNDWGQEEKGVTEDEMAGFGSPTQWTWVCANSGR